jgi:hypothetical protein
MIGVERDLALDLVALEILDHEHRVVIADGRLQEALRVGGRAGCDHLQSRRMGEEHLEALRVLRGQLVSGAVGGADDERATDRAAEHVADLGCVVDHLIRAVAVHGRYRLTSSVPMI